MMTARGTSRLGILASAANAVQDSKPNRIRMAMVACINVFSKFFGMITALADGQTKSVLSGLARRYQIAPTENRTSAVNWITLMTSDVMVEPLTPRYAMKPTTTANATAMIITGMSPMLRP